jgi:signal transduction histidine kinase/ligand-binding sensor domain-containing protein
MNDERGRIMFTHGVTSIVESCRSFRKGFEDRKVIGSIKGLRETTFLNKGKSGVWVSDHYNHLIRIDTTSMQTYDLNLDQSTDITAVLVDREESLWIANDPGVVKISNHGIKTYFFDQIAPAAAMAAFENDSVMWATNCKSLYRITNHKFEKINFPLAHSDYFGRLVFDSQNNLWISMWNGGIWRTKWKENICVEKEFYRDFGATIKVHVIKEDSKGTIFIAGINGLFVIKNKKVVQHFHPLNSYGGPAFINDMAIDEKNQTIWLADNASGVIKLNYTAIENGFDFKVAQFISVTQGLTDAYVRSLCLDKSGVLWAGTRSGGIYRIQQTNGSTIVTNCNKQAQITCTRIASIVSNDTGVWFATCDGAVRYDLSAGTWQHFGTAEGVLNNEVFDIAINKKNNTANFLTAQGITRLNLQLKEKTLPPPVRITSVKILGKPDTTALHSAVPRQYEYDQNSVGFEFVGLSFIDEKKIRYKYKLDGFDKNWSNPVATTSVNYASLPPGKYTFNVIAANARGEWSSVPASFSFEVVIPFYKTSWFLFLILSIAALILYFVREQRIKQRLKMERLRLSIARDLHDDIGSTLGSINLLSKSAIRKFQNASTEESVSVFEKIGQSAETTLDAMDDIVWTINPAKDKYQDMVVRMREFAIPLLEAGNIRFRFAISGNEEQSIPMHVRKNAFLIFKESIHNIIKHSNASEVGISLALSVSELSMNISDNGKGFNVGEASNRNGLKNMHYRSEAVGGSLKIVSSEIGTKIFFVASLR